jgi:hypothetical protein
MPSGDEIGTVRPLNRSRWGPTRVLLGPLGARASRGPKNRYSEFRVKMFWAFFGNRTRRQGPQRPPPPHWARWQSNLPSKSKEARRVLIGSLASSLGIR